MKLRGIEPDVVVAVVDRYVIDVPLFGPVDYSYGYMHELRVGQRDFAYVVELTDVDAFDEYDFVVSSVRVER